MKRKIQCEHCKEFFAPDPRIRNQRYCGKKVCQRARKTAWQREKMQTDPDYRRNQKDARDNWQKRHSGYWKNYRSEHPGYRKRNRELQKVRDARRRVRRLAKMDVLDPSDPLVPGTYFLIPVISDLAKMDASVRKIFLIPDTCMPDRVSCKKGPDGLGDGFSVQQEKTGGES